MDEPVHVIDLSKAAGERTAWDRPSWVVYLWAICALVFVTNPFQISSGLRARVLRLFGAKIGQGVVMRPRHQRLTPYRSHPRQAMEHRPRTEEGVTLYKRRGATVEPRIGNLKKILDKLSRRGHDAAASELHLAATAFNLLKIYRAVPTA